MGCLGKHSVLIFDVAFSLANMTKTLYNEIRGCFKTKFGKFAGWAHSILFTVDLPTFLCFEMFEILCFEIVMIEDFIS